MRGNLHVATGADIMLYRHHDSGIFGFKEPFVAFDQILVDALEECDPSGSHLVNPAFQIPFFFANRGDLGIVFRLVLGMGFVGRDELRGETLGFFHEDQLFVLDRRNGALGG